MTRDANVDFLKIQDGYLQEKLNVKGIIDITVLKLIEKNIILWKGDIATLKCGTIVNAANAQMLEPGFSLSWLESIAFYFISTAFQEKNGGNCHKYQ